MQLKIHRPDPTPTSHPNQHWNESSPGQGHTSSSRSRWRLTRTFDWKTLSAVTSKEVPGDYQTVRRYWKKAHWYKTRTAQPTPRNCTLNLGDYRSKEPTCIPMDIDTWEEKMHNRISENYHISKSCRTKSKSEGKGKRKTRKRGLYHQLTWHNKDYHPSN